MSENTRKDRITVRLTPSQMQVLKEIKDALGVSYSMLTRTIILDFLTRNENILNDIVDGKRKIDISDIIEEEDALY